MAETIENGMEKHNPHNRLQKTKKIEKKIELKKHTNIVDS